MPTSPVSSLNRSRFLFGKLISVVLLVTTIAVNAGAQVRDTINKKTPLLTGKDALLLGVFALGTAAVAPLDLPVANRLEEFATPGNPFPRGSRYRLPVAR